jgi:hypothetical protein
MKNAFALTEQEENNKKDTRFVFYSSLPAEKQSWTDLLRECIAASRARVLLNPFRQNESSPKQEKCAYPSPPPSNTTPRCMTREVDWAIVSCVQVVGGSSHPVDVAGSASVGAY